MGWLVYEHVLKSFKQKKNITFKCLVYIVIAWLSLYRNTVFKFSSILRYPQVKYTGYAPSIKGGGGVG